MKGSCRASETQKIVRIALKKLTSTRLLGSSGKIKMPHEREINDLTLNDSISWLFYSSRHRLQIRLGGKAQILTDTPLVRESWNKTLERSAKTYMTTLAPSTIVAGATTGLSPEYELREPTRAESAEAVGNFAVVVTQVNWMEWLWLNKKGHRRAQFVYNDDLTFKGDWLVP
jgi:pyridoxamine 5'-phosphate oxidase